MEAPAVLSHALLQQHTAKQINIQFLIVVVVREVFKVLTQDRVQQRGFRSRSSTFPFVEVLTVFSQDRVCCSVLEQIVEIPVPAGGGAQLPDPCASSYSAVSSGESGHGDLRTFAQDVRSARSNGSSSARVHPHSSSWTLEACVAEELAYADIEYEFLDYGGVSWVRRWILSWAGFAWWLIVPDWGWTGPYTRAEWDGRD